MYIVYAPMNIPDIWRFMVNGHLVNGHSAKNSHKIHTQDLERIAEGRDGRS